jgi:putative membrane protein insertion efficiency factor
MNLACETAASGAEVPSRSAAAWMLLLFVRAYITFLSPFFGGACRFHPSCSNYAVEAIQRHGARRGLGLAVWRLLRCNPFNRPGFDPVPDEMPSTVAPACSIGDPQ